MLNPWSTLPRKMRTLLIAIDGQTDESTYASGLSSFGDVPMLLRSLLDTGLLEIVPAAPSADAEPIPQPLRTVDARFSGRDAEALRSEPDRPTAPGPWSRMGNAFRSPKLPAPLPESLETAGWASLQEALALRDRPAFNPAGLAPTKGQHQLREVISLMSNFVMLHLPEESLAIVLVLEDLQSIEQAIASLQDYEMLISPAGEPARRHLAELRQALGAT